MVEIIQLYYNQSNVVNINNIKRVEIVDNASKFCVQCGKSISKKATRCNACCHLSNSKIKIKPSLQQLIKDIEYMGSIKNVAKNYGICVYTIQKWLRK
jgi:hypothetical protein